MRVLYSLGIYIYGFLIRLAGLFNSKAKAWVKGRNEKWPLLEHENQEVFWFHAASMGEFEQARPLIEKLKKSTNIKILLSFFSPSAYEIRKDYAFADCVVYLPLDTPSNARRFLDYYKPDRIIFVKYEFWYNFMYQIHLKQIPLYFVSAIFRPKQIFFKAWGTWFLKHLQRTNYFFCQDDSSVDLLKSHGVKQAIKTGDTRFDRVWQLSQKPNHFPEIESFMDGHKTMIFGSSWEDDEKLIHKFIAKNNLEWKLILVPHEVGKPNINRIESLFSAYNPVKYSEIKSIGSARKSKILIVDQVGFLMHLYQYSRIAYIGGGFGAGIHNTIEPAAFGNAVVFGPRYHKFMEAKALIQCGGGFSIHDFNDFEQILTSLMQNEEQLAKAQKSAQNLVAQYHGVSDRILEKILEFRTQ